MFCPNSPPHPTWLHTKIVEPLYDSLPLNFCPWNIFNSNFVLEQEANGENAENGDAEAEADAEPEEAKENGQVEKIEAESTTKEDEPGSSAATEENEEPVSCRKVIGFYPPACPSTNPHWASVVDHSPFCIIK